MSKIIEAEAIMREFNIKADDSVKFEEGKKNILLDKFDEYFDIIKTWAQIHYPEAAHIRHCAFAVLVMYFATDEYASSGNKKYQKERDVEELTIKFFNDCCESMDKVQLSIALIHFIESHLLARN